MLHHAVTISNIGTFYFPKVNLNHTTLLFFFNKWAGIFLHKIAHPVDCNKHNYNTIQPTLQCTVTCTPINWHAWVLRKRSRIFQTGIYYLFLSTDAHSTSTPRKAASLDDYFRPKQGENVGLLITLQISNAKREVILYLIFPNTLEPITDLWEKQREKFWNAWLYWECNSYHHQLLCTFTLRMKSKQ